MSENKIALAQILSNLNVTELNAMQKASIAAHEQHENIMLLSATGSGKTFAFLLPAAMELENQRATQCVVIAPTRELAMQIEKVFRSMGTGFKVSCCYGGRLRETEENNLRDAPALIVGTPGRLCDHIRRGSIKPETVTRLVFDEFDKCLEQGFEEEMAFLVDSFSNAHKTTFTSATQAIELPDFVHTENLYKVDFTGGETAGADTRLELYTLQSAENDKIDSLFDLLCAADGRAAIVFCNHRDSVERVHQLLKAKGIANEFYHGAMEQQERDSALVKFRNGTVNTLITTDLAARGLDIPHIRYIVHYHLPGSPEIFTHRNGRTARMEASGAAVLLLGPDEHMPDYIGEEVQPFPMPEELALPQRPKWSTLFISAGKKDKVNKGDIVGFLTAKGGLKADDIGLIESKDFHSFAAVRKSKMGAVLEAIKNERLKNKKVKIEIAK